MNEAGEASMENAVDGHGKVRVWTGHTLKCCDVSSAWSKTLRESRLCKQEPLGELCPLEPRAGPSPVRPRGCGPGYAGSCALWDTDAELAVGFPSGYSRC